MKIDPSKIKLFSIRNGSIEKLLLDYGFHVFACDSLQVPKDHFSSWFSALRKELKSIKPHIFYFFKDDHLPTYFFTTLKHEFPNMKFVMRYWDQRGRVPDQVRLRSSTLDTLVINNQDPSQYKMYHDIGIKNVRTLYNSTTKEEFYPLDIYRPYDAFFGGSNYNTTFPLSTLRKSLIKSVRNKHKLLVYGRGWDFLTQKPVRRSAYSDALQQAKINIGINHYNIVRYYSERTIQNPASGRLHLTYYIPGMEKDFGKNRQHLVWYKSVEECMDLLKYYLTHDEERSRIENSGREYVIKKFGLTGFLSVFSNIFYTTLGLTNKVKNY